MGSTVAIPEKHVERLIDFAFAGTFEAHLTVDATNLERRAEFQTTCEALGVGCVLIELGAGITRSQPMTSSHHRGEIHEILPDIERIYAGLTHAGFSVVRVKLEAMAFNDGVPLTDLSARDLAPLGGYFEFHAKLRLQAHDDMEALRSLCIEHHAHLSRNDREKERASDEARATHERFVTMRVRDRGRDSANGTFEALVAVLRERGYSIGAIKREYTIYDSRESLDDGWLPS